MSNIAFFGGGRVSGGGGVLIVVTDSFEQDYRSPSCMEATWYQHQTWCIINWQYKWKQNCCYFQVFVVVSVILFFIYMYYYIDHLHFHVTHAYAKIGSSTAQHHVAHKYLRGKRKVNFKKTYGYLLSNRHLSSHEIPGPVSYKRTMQK